MIARPRLLGLTLTTLALTACGNLPLSPKPSLLPTATITSGAEEIGTNSNPLPTTMTITGTNLQGATLDFGGKGGGTNLMINAAGTILTVTTPTGDTGRRPVIVSTPNGKVNAGVFTFRNIDFRPFVHLIRVNPISGPAAGGTIVTLIFDGDLAYNPADPPGFTVPDVYFGTVKATNVTAPVLGTDPSPVGQHTVTAVAPPGSGFVDITMKCPVAYCYTIDAYTITSVPFHYLP